MNSLQKIRALLVVFALTVFPVTPAFAEAYSAVDCEHNFESLFLRHGGPGRSVETTDRALLIGLRKKLFFLGYMNEELDAHRLKKIERIMDRRLENLARRGLTKQERNIYTALSDFDTKVLFNPDSRNAEADFYNKVVHVGGIKPSGDLTIYQIFLHEGAHVRDIRVTPYYYSNLLERTDTSMAPQDAVIAYREILANYAASGDATKALSISRKNYHHAFKAIDDTYGKPDGWVSFSTLDWMKYYKNRADQETYKLVQVARYLEDHGQASRVEGLLNEFGPAYPLTKAEASMKDKFPKEHPQWIEEKARELLALWAKYPGSFKGGGK